MLNAFLTWLSKMVPDYCENYTRAEHQLKRRPRNDEAGNRLIREQREEEEFCRQQGLNRKAMRKTHLYVEDIMRRLIEVGYFVGEKCRLVDYRNDLLKYQRENGKNMDHIRLLKFIVAGASYPYYFNFIPENEEEANKNANNFNPFTTVYFSNWFDN